jgi:nitrite reductase/ring-hydroxylating ferredoxin subunit/uncharacterized membrane protein
MLELEQKIISPVARSNWIDKLAGAVQGGLNKLFLGSQIGRRSKDFLNGVWLAHPLHPAVTDVPIGAWTTAVALDGIEALTGRDLQKCTSAAIGVGVGGAALAAISGMADWADLRGEQRRIGMVHALSNLLAAGLFSASLWRRLSGNRAGATALSSAGFLSVALGGYLGGDLTYRLGTQVNRNAWNKEAKQFIPVMREEELLPEQPTRVDVQGVPVMLVRRGDEIYAMNDVCSHQGGPLSKGHLEDGNIVCPWHGSTYKLEDGSVVHGPSPFPQPYWEVRVIDGQIEVRAEPVQI